MLNMLTFDAFSLTWSVSHGYNFIYNLAYTSRIWIFTENLIKYRIYVLFLKIFFILKVFALNFVFVNLKIIFSHISYFLIFNVFSVFLYVNVYVWFQDIFLFILLYFCLFVSFLICKFRRYYGQLVLISWFTFINTWTILVLLHFW